jgi:uncharacterized membrane protein YfcA
LLLSLFFAVLLFFKTNYLEFLGYLLSTLIGVSLGLIGSGGSILAVPILVYLFGVTPENATTHSLFIVGITSVIASYKHHRQNNLKIKTALLFGIPSLITLLLTRKYILPALPETIFSTDNFQLSKHTLIMVVFSVLMIAAALSMIRRSRKAQNTTVSDSRLIIIGLLVGFVTGFLGAGGGFLIVPALLFYANLDLKYAIATSVFIITINSLIGFAGDLINGVQFDKLLLAKVSAAAILGIFIGIGISKKMDGKKLKPLFGWFILIMGVFIVVKELVIG